jgi:DNA-binding beta-propeller fold protein YncE
MASSSLGFVHRGVSDQKDVPASSRPPLTCGDSDGAGSHRMCRHAVPLSVLVFTALAATGGLPVAAGHCAGEGFPDSTCGGCATGSHSPVPRVDTLQSSPPLGFPGGVAVAPDGTFALASSFASHAVTKIDLAHCSPGFGCPGAILAGGGVSYEDDVEGTAARLDSPAGMAITPDGSTALVAEFRGHRIRAVDTATGKVRTLAGSGDPGYEDGTGTKAELNSPTDITISADGRRAVVADLNNHKIRAIDLLTGSVTTMAGNYSGSSGDLDGEGREALFFRPRSVIFTSDGTKVLIADRNNNKIRMLDVDSRAVTTLAGATGPDEPQFADGKGTSAKFFHPRHVIIVASQHTEHGDTALVSDGDNHRIRAIDLLTKQVTTFAGTSVAGLQDGTLAAAAARFNTPRGLAHIPGTGMALVADSVNGVLRLLTR